VIILQNSTQITKDVLSKAQLHKFIKVWLQNKEKIPKHIVAVVVGPRFCDPVMGYPIFQGFSL